MLCFGLKSDMPLASCVFERPLHNTLNVPDVSEYASTYIASLSSVENE
jgi:hypothetical protein